MIIMLDLVSLSLRASANCEGCNLQLVKSSCAYYHYMCDQLDDRVSMLHLSVAVGLVHDTSNDLGLHQGWGCGYRSLQSLCSWADRKREPDKSSRVPSARQIQDVLVELGDKPPSFANSKDWIGCFEACIVLEHVYGVSIRFNDHTLYW